MKRPIGYRYEELIHELIRAIQADAVKSAECAALDKFRELMQNMYIEYGYKCCEKGMNLQQALIEKGDL